MFTPSQSLLDYLANSMACTYLSDLNFLDSARRRMLAREVERIPTGDVSLREWNDALSYLTGGLPAHSSQEAKRRLVAGLSQDTPAGTTF